MLHCEWSITPSKLRSSPLAKIQLARTLSRLPNFDIQIGTGYSHTIRGHFNDEEEYIHTAKEKQTTVSPSKAVLFDNQTNSPRENDEETPNSPPSRMNESNSELNKI